MEKSTGQKRVNVFGYSSKGGYSVFDLEVLSPF